jgi:isohexenylglutaconyl-CoA hydratase
MQKTIDAMQLGAVRAVSTGAILHIYLNRPEARNAMSLQMVAELQQVLLAAQATAGTPDAVRVVVLRGEGGHFSAGARMRATQRAEGVPDPIAEVNAAFRLPETSLGVVPAQIAPFLVERLDYSQAKRLAVTGGWLDAAGALAATKALMRKARFVAVADLVLDAAAIFSSAAQAFREAPHV